MGKWTCKCGQYMNDHNAPDENCYLVFADTVWSQIDTDENGNTNFYDLPLPTFDVYVCPSCGRLMVFGNSNRCTFYKLEDF